MSRKSRILVFMGFYLPGFKAGGPIKTIFNMVEQLSDEYEFLIVTRDRDSADADSYVNVPLNQWVPVGKAHVFYCSPKQQTVSNLAKVINDTEFDVLYLNSFFDPVFTLKPLLARYLGSIPKGPVVLAPRGEFSEGAVQLKWPKKKLFILVTRLFKLYKSIVWQASSEHEFEDIKRVFHVQDKDILIALDLTEKTELHATVVKESNSTLPPRSFLRIVFLSRISPMKNLDYALSLLQKVVVPVQFDIYGPKEDAEYWSQCLRLINTLPKNIVANYCGSVNPNEVSSVFSRYDLFLFPTRGENYGHVIAESLSVGTPVLISDQTPWRDLETDSLGWEFSLSDTGKFLSAIELCAQMSNVERYSCRQKVVKMAQKRINNPDDIKANKALFSFAINSIKL